ncbi:unnamed protein product, partial [Discosporangium mesarthrocarpum]
SLFIGQTSDRVYRSADVMTRWLILVTGASRGFGRHVAEEFVRSCAPTKSLDVILLARSSSGLDETAASLRGMIVPDSHHLSIRKEIMDLGDLDHLEDRFDSLLHSLDPEAYSQAILVNNAGSLGHMGFVHEMPSLTTLRQEIDFNVTSGAWLTSRFVKLFGVDRPDKSSAETKERVGEGQVAGESKVHTSADDASRDESAKKARLKGSVMVINVSSLAAIQPFESWGTYSMGKAAREMFHRVLAKEQSAPGGVRVLNYSPGPMDTDMQREIRNSTGFFHPYRPVCGRACVALLPLQQVHWCWYGGAHPSDRLHHCGGLTCPEKLLEPQGPFPFCRLSPRGTVL